MTHNRFLNREDGTQEDRAMLMLVEQVRGDLGRLSSLLQHCQPHEGHTITDRLQHDVAEATSLLRASWGALRNLARLRQGIQSVLLPELCSLAPAVSHVLRKATGATSVRQHAQP